MISFTFHLTKPARKTGGDRYECDGSDWTIYVPQEISRPKGAPVQTLKITVDRLKEDV